jgi:hypothetical protein
VTSDIGPISDAGMSMPNSHVDLIVKVTIQTKLSAFAQTGAGKENKLITVELSVLGSGQRQQMPKF